MKPQTIYWVETAEYDLDTAEAMYQARRWVYVIFMCHLTLEKLLKACVSEFTDGFPPRIHNLVRLAQIANIQFPAEMRAFVVMMSDQGVVTRYPHDLGTYTQSGARGCLDNTREVFAWLRQILS